MVKTMLGLLWILLFLIAVPVSLLVAWKILCAIISNCAGVVFALILFAVIVIVAVILL